MSGQSLLQSVQTDTASRRRRKRLILALLLALSAAFLALFLALEYRPAWYAPAVLTETQLQQGRMDAMRVVDLVGDQLVERKPFEIALSDEQVNTWLSGIAQIWPDAAQRIPREIVEPFVDFEAGSLRLASRLESNGWRAIVSIDCGLQLSGDRGEVIVRISAARCGAVALPRFALDSLLNPYLRAESMDGSAVEQLFEGLPLENRFVWPNGRRPFRIGAISVEQGTIRLRIEPL